ncbi:MAG: hypothetical protein PUC98_05625 [Clostridiales bacterium]|nr:hypothetical protein [Clostridiales bacterium]
MPTIDWSHADRRHGTGMNISQRNEQLKRAIRRTVLFTVLVAFTFICATFAWFSFSTSTNVTPMRGSVNGSGVELLISNAYDGEYAFECELLPENDQGGDYGFEPVSTYDLENFFEAVSMNTDSMADRYADVTDSLDNKLMKGTVYLKAQNADAEVFFDPEQMELSFPDQMMTSMRLGIRLSSSTDDRTYIFRLDGLSTETGAAEETSTVPQDNVVVYSIDSAGNAEYAEDPSLDIMEYCAAYEDTKPIPGTFPLTLLSKDDICTVMYWFYLEGCDVNTFNPVQENEGEIDLAFAGTGVRP